MSRHPFSSSRQACVLAVMFLVLTAGSLHAAEIQVIGRIESLLRDRASLRIIQLISTPTAEIDLEEGSWVSFDMPKIQTKNARRRNIRFGNIVEVDLAGMAATEYAPEGQTSQEEGTDPEVAGKPGVMIWTASRVERVQDPKPYLTDEDKKSGRQRKRDRKKKKNQEPTKIWTQEETVRGSVYVRGNHLYIKEERLGKRDKGLQVISPEWEEKLKELNGRKVVLHGTTHRVTVSSGTMEINNLMRIYPK